MLLRTACIAGILCTALFAGASLAQMRGQNPGGAQQGGAGQPGGGGGFGGGGPGGGGFGGGGFGGGGPAGGFGGGGPGGGFGGGGFGGFAGLGGFGGVPTVIVQDPTNEMAQVLPDLSDDQKTKLKDTLVAQQQAANQFRTDSYAKLQETMQIGDQQAIQDQTAALAKAAAELQAKDDAEFETLLTPAQKEKWESYLLAQLIKTRLVAAAITKEQSDKIDTLCLAVAKDVVAAKDADAKSKIYGLTFKKVLDDVTTDDQAGKVLSATARNAVWRNGG